MNCDQFSDLYELFALGLLEGDELAAFQKHLAEGCETCRAGVARAASLNELITRNVPLVEPPTRLRKRIVATVNPAKPSSPPFIRWATWAAVAALLCLLAGAAIYERTERQTAREQHEADIRTHVADVRAIEAQLARVQRLTQVIDMVGAVGTREVPFGNAAAGAPNGRLFLNPQRGLLLLITRLNPAPAGSKYESWIVPVSGAPRPISAFAPDATGTAILFIPGPVDPAAIKAMAVSREPAAIQPVTPTTVLFAAPAI